MSAHDAAFGAKVLVGNANWNGAGWPLRAAAICFGRFERFDHLDKRIWISWLFGHPYLVSIREVRG